MMTPQYSTDINLRSQGLIEEIGNRLDSPRGGFEHNDHSHQGQGYLGVDNHDGFLNVEDQGKDTRDHLNMLPEIYEAIREPSQYDAEQSEGPSDQEMEPYHDSDKNLDLHAGEDFHEKIEELNQHLDEEVHDDPDKQPAEDCDNGHTFTENDSVSVHVPRYGPAEPSDYAPYNIFTVSNRLAHHKTTRSEWNRPQGPMPQRNLYILPEEAKGRKAVHPTSKVDYKDFSPRDLTYLRRSGFSLGETIDSMGNIPDRAFKTQDRSSLKGKGPRSVALVGERSSHQRLRNGFCSRVQRYGKDQACLPIASRTQRENKDIPDSYATGLLPLSSANHWHRVNGNVEPGSPKMSAPVDHYHGLPANSTRWFPLPAPKDLLPSMRRLLEKYGRQMGQFIDYLNRNPWLFQYYGLSRNTGEPLRDGRAWQEQQEQEQEEADEKARKSRGRAEAKAKAEVGAERERKAKAKSKMPQALPQSSQALARARQTDRTMQTTSEQRSPLKRPAPQGDDGNWAESSKKQKMQYTMTQGNQPTHFDSDIPRYDAASKRSRHSNRVDIAPHSLGQSQRTLGNSSNFTDSAHAPYSVYQPDAGQLSTGLQQHGAVGTAIDASDFFGPPLDTLVGNQSLGQASAPNSLSASPIKTVETFVPLGRNILDFGDSDGFPLLQNPQTECPNFYFGESAVYAPNQGLLIGEERTVDTSNAEFDVDWYDDGLFIGGLADSEGEGMDGGLENFGWPAGLSNGKEEDRRISRDWWLE